MVANHPIYGVIGYHVILTGADTEENLTGSNHYI